MASQGLPPYSAHHLHPRIPGTLQARLHNFVKQALLQQLVPPGSTVCDLYCGQGVDTGKWAQAQIGRYVGVDIATSTLEEAQEQWNNLNRPYPADFCEADPSSVNLETELRYTGLPADFVTCMSRLQDSFYKEEMVKILLQNVASILKPGGYFFGITADSSTIWSKFQKAVEGAHRAGVFRALPRVHSEHYTISFEDDRFTPFGTRYTLQFADGVIFEGQQLIHFPSFIRLAEEVGLEYVELQNLQEYYDDYRLHFPDLLRSTCLNLVDPKGRLPQFTHDILSLYTTFIFRKAEDLDPDYISSPYPTPDENEDAVDGIRASFQEYMLPVKEINAGLKLMTTAFQQIETREACHPKLEEEKRPHSSVLHTEENIQVSPKGDGRKEIANVERSSGNGCQPDSEFQELRLDSREPEIVMISSSKGDNEVQTSERCLAAVDATSIEVSGASCDSQAAHDLRICMEGPPEASIQSNVKSSSQNEFLHHQDVIKEGSISHLQANVEDDEMREALTETSAFEEVCNEQKEQTSSEKLDNEENVGNMHASISPEETVKLSNAANQLEGPSVMAVLAESKRVTDLETEEKAISLQADDSTKERPKQPEGSNYADAQKMASPRKESGEYSAKRGGNAIAREEARNSFSKRLNAGGSEHHNRSGRPHHYHHLSHTEERQDHSHGPRHSHPSSHKGSRDRIGDHHRSDLSSPTQRGDGRRGRGRSRSAVAAAHAPAPPPPPPAFFPFSHFVPQTEFPIFQSPNTPGILGPGPPPVLLIEPFCQFWPIPAPLERRVFPKTRTPRKHGNDRDSTGNRSSNRRDSPKRQWKDSPPPGTES